jgi:hypothetical protein
MDWLNALEDWGELHATLLWWLFGISVVATLLTPLIATWVIIKLPTDYFIKEKRRSMQSLAKYPALRVVVTIAKNLLGLVLLVAGVIMLVAPGQGLLTIAVSLVLLDFPGKFRLQRWVVTRPQVWRSIRWMRKKARKPELEKPE